MAVTETIAEVPVEIGKTQDTAACEGCFLNGQEAFEAHRGGCTLFDAVASHMPHRSQQIAHTLLSGPDGKFVRRDVLPQVEEGDTPAALAQRFITVAQFLSGHGLLRGALSSHGVRGGSYFLLDREVLHQACAEIQADPSIVERTRETDQVRKAVIRDHSGKAYANILLLLLDDEYEAGGRIELASGVLASCRNFMEIYPGIEVEYDITPAAPGRTSRPCSFINIPPETRQSLVGHMREAAISEITLPEGLTPAGDAVLGSVGQYIHHGRQLPDLSSCSLAELKYIQQQLSTSLQGMDVRHIDGQSVETARLRQVNGMIDDIFVFWKVDKKSRKSAKAKVSPGHKLLLRKIGTLPEFQDRGSCNGIDPDLFYPERGASTRDAKEVCKGCVVREECLEYALSSGEKFGIWGGMSERERRRIRRQRSLARRALKEAEVATA